MRRLWSGVGLAALVRAVHSGAHGSHHESHQHHNHPAEAHGAPSHHRHHEAAHGHHQQHHRSSADADIDAPAPPAKPIDPVEEKFQPKIRVTDHKNNVVPIQPLKRFSDIAEDLPGWLNEGIVSSGFKAPTAVQSVAIPLLLEERDVVGIAPTGSGKTVAFAVPALSSVQIDQRGHPGQCEPTVLVLCPTRELCQQTHQVFRTLGGGKAFSAAAFGGADRERQADHLRRGADVLVATPGRLCDFLDDNIVTLKCLSFLVLDEADRMLEMGFAPQLARIMDCVDPKKKRRTMMWSATWSPTVEKLAHNFMSTDRIMVSVDAQQRANRDITQNVYALSDEKDRLRRIVQLYEDKVIAENDKLIVFANHKETVDNLAEALAKELRMHWSAVQPLHGGMKQPKRDAVIRNFREGRIRILVATDVAARGLDVKDVDHVINYDLPNDTDSFVHRVGRTGRAGRKGHAHTFFVQGVNPGTTVDIAEALHRDGVKLSTEVLSAVTRANHYAHSEKKRQKYVDHGRLKGNDWKAPTQREWR